MGNDTMDSEFCTEQLIKGKDISPDSLNNKLDEPCGNGYEADKKSSVVTVESASLGPITPDCGRENGGSHPDFQSPLTLMSSPSKNVSIDPCRDEVSLSNVDHSPNTPKEGVFDPFAPGPDELALAPLCKKYLREARIRVARRLNFDSSLQFTLDENCGDGMESLYDEESMLESAYGTLLEAIVLEQTEGIFAEVLPEESTCGELKTPTSSPLLSGVSEICPGAPVKATRELRNIDVSLCRKLEF